MSSARILRWVAFFLLVAGALSVTIAWVPFLRCPSCLAISRTLKRDGFFIQFADIDKPEAYKTGCPDCHDRGFVSPLRYVLSVPKDSRLVDMLENPGLRQKNAISPYRSSQHQFFSSLKSLLGRSSLPLAQEVSREADKQRFSFGQMEFLPSEGRSHMLGRLLQGRKIRHDPMVAVLVLFTTSGDVADIVTLTTLSDKGIVDVRFLSPTALDDSVAEFSVSNDPFFEACKLVCSTSEKVLFRGKGHFEGKVRIGVKGGKFVVLPES